MALKIAIVRLSAMGDIVHSTFILEAIKKAHPLAQIDWITEELFAPLLSHNPYLHKVHTVNLKKLKKERSLKLLFGTIKKLKTLAPYDIVIDLQGLLKSALVSRYLGKNRVGFDKNSIREPLASLFYTTKVSISYKENAIYRTAYLSSQALHIHIDKKSIDTKKKALFYNPKQGLPLSLPQSDYIVMVSGSSMPYKNYPKEQFAQVIEALNMPAFLVWGNEAERQTCQEIAALTSFAHLCPALSIPELIELIDKAALTIGNDTGPTHMAWALNRPSIVLFGATSAQKLMWETDINIALESQTPKNPLKIDKKDFSIKNIEVEQIVQTAQRLLHARH